MKKYFFKLNGTPEGARKNKKRDTPKDVSKHKHEL